jgi:hypothetical protein
MSTRLDDLITSARTLDGAWDGDRAVRVREGALRRRDSNVRRDRALRRGLLVASGAGLLVLALLRAASSAPAEPTTFATTSISPTATPAAAPTAAATAEALASRTFADAGYARD